jgi:cell division septal protein FtsQ
MIDAAHVREYTGLREGINLFGMNIGRLRREFLAKTPHARNLVITRRLPDRLLVAVQERETLARLGRWGHLGVDREGRVFSVRAASRELPVLSGFPAGRLMPGAQVDATVVRGLEVIEACRRGPAGNTVRLSSIDVAPAEFVELYLVGGERVKLSWDSMGAGTAQGRSALDHKLDLIAKALQSAQARGKRVATLDMTFGDHYMPSQEY